MTKLLTDEFLADYRYKQPKWGFGGLGYIVYLRTYARTKSDGTLERWDETVERITEGNFKIEVERLKEIGKLNDDRLTQLQAEAERFYHLVFNLVMTPPGRGLWMSGTEYAERVGDAENNCWGVSMRPQSYTNGQPPKVSFAPVFTFDQAMKGGGVGVNVQRQYVAMIPKVSNTVDVSFVCDATHADYETELKALGVEARIETVVMPFIVEDSREGWASALAHVIDAHYEGLERVVIDISEVRPRGAAIVGFGGTASGPSPLIEMLATVNEILNGRVDDYVTPTEWGDVIQNIGKCVVAGNVRRTALILIGDNDDKEFVESKNYSLPQNQKATNWRWASNNSVSIGVDTDRETLRNMAVNIYYNGEPGYTGIELSRNYGRIIDGFQKDIDGEVEVFNPCGEITLPNASPCNLFEINLARIEQLVKAGTELESLYEEAAYLATRYAYRITFRHYEWEATRDVVYRHRRLGVGITGITDWALLRYGAKAIEGFDEQGNAIYNAKMTQFLDELYKAVVDANKQQAAELDANPSIKVTTVKPSGTVSLLMGASPGMHYHWAPYMIRRVRMSSDAPLIPVLRECGYTIEEAVVGYKPDGSPNYDSSTLVVEFPTKAPTAEYEAFQSAGDVPLREQAALQAMLATYWSDNAVSATLSFHQAKQKPTTLADGTQLLDKFGNPVYEADKAQEQAVIDEITDILDRYKGTIKSTSLLPYASGTYPQMPYEAITKAKFDEMVSQLTAKPWEVLSGDLIAETEDTTDYSTECVGNSCPLK